MSKENLVASFAVRSLVVILVTALVLGWVATRSLDDAVLAQSAHAGSTIANSLVSHAVTDDDLGDGLDRSTEVEMDDLMDSLSSSGIVAIKVWDDSGVLAYSSNDSDPVGVRVNDHEVEDALAGETVTELILEPDEENRTQFEDAGELLEVYSPLLSAAGDVIGVFEIYQPYAPVREQLEKTNLLIWAVVVCGALLAYALQIGIIRRTQRRLHETVEAAAALEDRLRDSLTDFEEQSLGTLEALIGAVDAKDSYTARHSLMVAEYAANIGVALGLSEEQRRMLERAALLHDIGKIGTPGEILRKPGPLEEEERAIMDDHSDMGAKIIGAIPTLADVAETIRHHHEHWDGTGYPDGLWGEQIPLSARILAVADAFDAMTSDRPYRSGLSLAKAAQILEEAKGTQFDTFIVDAFLQQMDIPPLELEEEMAQPVFA